MRKSCTIFEGLLNQRDMLGQATNWHEDDGAEELQDGHDAQDFACKPSDVGPRFFDVRFWK